MASQFDRDELAKNLPDAYRKDEESNNARILGIEKSALDRLRSEIEGIYESLDIDRAYGSTLDLYGEMIGQTRGIATDDQYRVLIKNKIVRNFSSADYNSIIRAICVTFDCAPSDVQLVELDDPCKVKMEGLPISRINECNIDISTAVSIVNGLLPVGVYMEAITFSGTFEFSGETLEYDENAGFSDEAQTIGGYLGLVSDGFGSNLPI